MTAQSLMRRCAELGIKLTLRSEDDGRLVVDAPKGTLTADLRDALTERKPDLIAILKTQAQAASRVRQPLPEAAIRAERNTKVPASEDTSLMKNETRTATAVRSGAETEVLKLLAGEAFNATVIDAKNPHSRETVRTHLLTAL